MLFFVKCSLYQCAIKLTTDQWSQYQKSALNIMATEEISLTLESEQKCITVLKIKAERPHCGSSFQEMRSREKSQPIRKQALGKGSGSRV